MNPQDYRKESVDCGFPRFLPEVFFFHNFRGHFHCSDVNYHLYAYNFYLEIEETPYSGKVVKTQ